jgi:hypothetical protein
MTEEIQILKEKLPKSAPYRKIVKASRSKVTHQQVKNFFTGRSVSENAQIIIVKMAKEVINDQRKKALSLKKLAQSV